MTKRKLFLIIGSSLVVLSLLMFVIGFSGWYWTFLISVIPFYLSGEFSD